MRWLFFILCFLIDPLSVRAADSVDLEKARQHWAFLPFNKIELPKVKQPGWGVNEVDRFVGSRLEKAELLPSEPADKATLIRRVYFDLIGLPPSPEQVRAFLANKSPLAYEKLIDGLLASPHYGERWGRHWLDLARYADSSGYHSDIDRPNAWRYRDYVIKSFNDDKPYAQFIREQLAGDEVAPKNAQSWIATGFCRNGPSNDGNVRPAFAEQYRLDQLDDVISTTGITFLGITVGCARCHDHKTAPISQIDYYRLLAVFNNAVPREVPMGQDGQLNLKKMVKSGKKNPKPGLMALTEVGAEPRLTHLLIRGQAKNQGEEVQPGVPKVLEPLQPVSFNSKPNKASRTTGRRLIFADWVAAENNTLTWRVHANRIWQFHFGHGLVRTPNDFGPAGSLPTHPALLEWLAQQLIIEGGCVKPIHKKILMSATYRQSSSYRAEAHAKDQDNLLYWRVSKRRLEAEAIRDGILVVSGKLNRKTGGPGIKPRIPHEIIDQRSQRNKWPKVKQERIEHWRRSVYVYVKRQLMMPMLEMFDMPSPSMPCSRRIVSTIPTQALTLLNDPFVNEQAAYCAREIIKISDDKKAQAKEALWRVLARPPKEEWIEEGRRFLDKEGETGLTDFIVVLINSSQFSYVD
ncbi:MAG TPA: DUF1549 domain-containing protein [Verrucomicrobia bacterium]|nr:DUF1549 domain-containing protein [Verrucomicrobiales bacterium]HIL53891.1 DUF1549 domain-containing protein [Verrucomicrobiota bacterium]